MKTLLSAPTVLFALLASCGGSTPPASNGEAPAEVTPTAPAVASPVPSPAATPVPNGMLTALQNGDRACYVIVKMDDGEVSMEGDFDLCAPETEALIGKRVTWKTEKANVQAASCEGSPDCTASDRVDLVISVSLHSE